MAHSNRLLVRGLSFFRDMNSRPLQNDITRACINKDKFNMLYEEIFSKFMVPCHSVSSKHKFKVKNKL